MKRVSNWLFGGFFRTIGRTLAFLLIGALIGLIAYKNDISLYRLLGIETVSAQTVSKSSDQWATQWCNNPNCGFAVADATYYRDYVNVNTGAYTNSNHYFLRAMRLKMTFNSSNYLQSGTQYQIRYKIWFNPLYSLNSYQLSNDNIDFTVTDSGNNQTQLTEGYNCGFQAINNTTSFFLTCLYTPSSSIKQVYVRIRFDSYITIDTNDADDVEIFRMNSINYTSSSVTYATGDKEAIEQQTTVIQNQTNEIINQNNQIIDGQEEIKDTLLDDNISDSDYSDKLDDLEIDNDTWQGPFSAFLLLPLNWVQNILASNQVCQPINLPIPFTNSTLTLPCMTEFWSRLGALSTLIQLCWLAVVGVRIFNGLFVLTVEVTSAKGNADELTKIRSWEL